MGGGGGCTIQGMYSHTADIFNSKPDYIMSHIGMNDCMTKTSNEVIKEISNLTKYIKNVLPSAEIIISLPTMRYDNKVAKSIVNNANVKLLQRGSYHLLDNLNIKVEHIGKKGLHFNAYGVKRMAKNIISLVRKL